MCPGGNVCSFVNDNQSVPEEIYDKEGSPFCAFTTSALKFLQPYINKARFSGLHITDSATTEHACIMDV